MSAEIVPFIVLGLAVSIAMRLPLGKDLAVPAFLLPWFALTPDIGFSLPLSKIVFAVLIIKYLVHGRFDPVKSSIFLIYILLLASGLGAASFALWETSSGVEFVGGAFRNGWLRVFVTAVSLTLGFAPIFLLLAKKVDIPFHFLIRCICISLLTLCLIGIFQFAVFVITGIDILPLGLFTGAEAEDLRTGLVSMGGSLYMRPGSLSGEPKSLGITACVLLLMLITMGRQIFPSKFARYLASGAGLLTVLLTQSTSAFVSLCLGLAVYLGLRRVGRPLRTGEVFSLYTVGAVLILTVFLTRVSDTDTIGLSTQYIEEPDSIISLLQSRTVNRLEVEDFDVIILKSMLNDPTMIVIGKGLGLAHLFTNDYIPDVWRYYMQDRIIFPKTGLTFYLASGGIFSVFLFVMLMTALTPGIQRERDLLDRRLWQYLIVVQRTVIPLMFLAMIRIYVLELSLLVGAILTLSLQYAVNIHDRRNLLPVNRNGGRRPVSTPI
ncbi:hypothetical protein [Mesorhizobium mediterraneum]|uniref:hypothetical protein n=1 Tax=Mesorhizobium mediterraneum TaxID=43617 RepID=UPI00177E08B3|nr:hypothetical protein [Mesorhizobium mediterraneum]